MATSASFSEDSPRQSCTCRAGWHPAADWQSALVVAGFLPLETFPSGTACRSCERVFATGTIPEHCERRWDCGLDCRYHRGEWQAGSMLSWLFSDPLPIGTKAPDFELPSESGKTVKLAALRGKNVVLVFYPADDTTICRQQLCEFRDNWSQPRSATQSSSASIPDRKSTRL